MEEERQPAEAGPDGGEAPRMPANGQEWAHHVWHAVAVLKQAEDFYLQAYAHCVKVGCAAAEAMYPRADSEELKSLAYAGAERWLATFQEGTANVGTVAERMAELMAEEWGKAHRKEGGGELLASILPCLKPEGPAQ
jgi:hypothetical protein